MLDVAENAELEQYLRACVSVFNPRSVTECSLYHTTGRRDYVEKKKKIIAIEKGGGGIFIPRQPTTMVLEKKRGRFGCCAIQGCQTLVSCYMGRES